MRDGLRFLGLHRPRSVLWGRPSDPRSDRALPSITTTTLHRAETADDFAALAILVREYVESLPFPLDFQDVDHELSALEEEYSPPRGVAIIARAGDDPVGCVALRPFEPPAVAELKRMYVRPSARGAGAGRALASAALEAARDLGYNRVLLDTVAEMVEAARVYQRLGFVEIGPYRHNPLPTARFYEMTLAPVAPTVTRETASVPAEPATAKAPAEQETAPR